MKHIILVFVFTLLFCCNVNAQSEVNHKSIDSLGRAFTSRLKNGNIEYLKDSKPPKGTYTYKRLLEFKEALENYPDKIRFGSIVEPSINPDYYAFNLFAYKRTGERSFEYFFAAIISIDISGDSYKIDNTYLFTEQSSLGSWWSHILGFYEGEAIKDIPKEYVFPVCPPPPYKVE